MVKLKRMYGRYLVLSDLRERMKLYVDMQHYIEITGLYYDLEELDNEMTEIFDSLGYDVEELVRPFPTTLGCAIGDEYGILSEV